MLDPDSLFAGIFLVGVLVGWLIRFYYGKRVAKDRVKVERRSHLEFALVVLAFVAMHVMPLVYLLTDRLDFVDYPMPLAGRLPGVAVYGAGLWLFWRSHADLGQNWSPIPRILRGQSLVTGGVYGRIRHPMYAGHWLGAVAQALLIPNWIAGASFVGLFLVFYLLRVPREERLMLEFFGERYRDYMTRTNRLTPRLEIMSCIGDF